MLAQGGLGLPNLAALAVEAQAQTISPNLFGNASSFFAPTVGMGPSPQTITEGAWVTTLNAADKSANISLSNNNLTAGCTTNTDGAVRSTVLGGPKAYFEFIIGNMVGANTGVGIATSVATLTTIGPNATNAAIVYGSGNLWYNGSNSGITIGNITASGTRVCVALDTVANRLWVRKDGGLWNGSGTANPATGIGGLDISVVFVGKTALAAISANSSAGVSLSVNFGATPLAQAIPTGFYAQALGNQFFVPGVAVAAATIAITPNLVTSTDTFFAPTVTVDVRIQPSLFTNSNTFFVPMLAFSLRPNLFINLNVIFTPAVIYPQFINVMERVVNASFVHAPEIKVGVAPEIPYTFPIDHSLYADYGRRAALMNYKKHLIIGKRL